MDKIYVDLIIKGKRKLSDVKPKAMYDKVRVSLIKKYVQLINDFQVTIEDVPLEIVEEVEHNLL